MLLNTDKFDEAQAYRVNGATKEWAAKLAEFIHESVAQGLTEIQLPYYRNSDGREILDRVHMVRASDPDLRQILEDYHMRTSTTRSHVQFVFGDAE